MKKTLIISGHPDMSKSIYNAKILDFIRNSPNTIINDLSTKSTFNMREEQELLMNHDIIVLMSPAHWYSVSALLKKWLDEVLVYGFAYGPGGDKLNNKKVIISITFGGEKHLYDTKENGGEVGFTSRDVLNHLACIWPYTGANLVDMLIFHGCTPESDYIDSDEFHEQCNNLKKIILSLQ